MDQSVQLYYITLINFAYKVQWIEAKNIVSKTRPDLSSHSFDMHPLRLTQFIYGGWYVWRTVCETNQNGHHFWVCVADNFFFVSTLRIYIEYIYKMKQFLIPLKCLYKLKNFRCDLFYYLLNGIKMCNWETNIFFYSANPLKRRVKVPGLSLINGWKYWHYFFFFW